MKQLSLGKQLKQLCLNVFLKDSLEKNLKPPPKISEGVFGGNKIYPLIPSFEERREKSRIDNDIVFWNYVFYFRNVCGEFCEYVGI